VSALRAILTRPRRLPALRRPRLVHVVAAALCLLLLLGSWLWLRDSSLVKVTKVRVTGVSGPDAGRVRLALSDAAADMTTLHVRRDQLLKAAEPFPVVRDIQVSTDFPHGLRIRVIPHVPVGVVVADGRHIAVASDGTILRGESATEGLAAIPVATVPGGTHLSDARALAAVKLLGAAPAPLRVRVVRVTSGGGHGLTVKLRAGPQVYFGDSERVTAKWAAAARVLADPSSRGATYVDVRIPERPVAGGVAPDTQINPGPDPTVAAAQAALTAQAQQAVTGTPVGGGTPTTQQGTVTPPQGSADADGVNPQP
jgi:cell division protein FtsQ